MKRRVIEFIGARDLRMTEEEIPAPKDGEVLVATRRTLVSTGTESICYARNFAAGTHFDQWVKYPFRPGYLHCGVVEKVGAKVENLRVGQRVATRGGHASHVILQADAVVPVPPALSDEEAAWMGLGKITQIGARAAAHALGDTVVVIGLGLLGQLVAQYAAVSGAREIIAIDPWPTRLDRLTFPSGAHKLACSAADAATAVRQITGGRGADVVYEVTGHHAVFPSALGLARDFGTVVLLGDTGQPHLQTLTPDVITRGLRIVGAHDRHAPKGEQGPGIWTERRMFELFLHYLDRGQMRVKHLVSHRYRAEEAKQAYEMLQADRATAMGVILEWDAGLI